jgi:hypothetical protein
LKQTTTLFTYTKEEKDSLEILKKAILSVWSLTKIDFIPLEDLHKYIDDPKYSFFSIDGQNIKTTWSNRDNPVENTSWNNTYIYLNLWTQTKDKKGRVERFSYARIELFPSFETMTSKNVADIVVCNRSIGLLKVYVGCVHNYLANNGSRFFFSESVNQQEIANLQQEMLYVPDYTLVKFNSLSGDESKRHDEKILFKDYKFNYKIVTLNDLDNKILNSDKPIYFLSYVKSSSTTFVTIYNSQANEIIYTNRTSLSFNIKEKNIAQLVKAIKK